jgi:hypothetical protein
VPNVSDAKAARMILCAYALELVVVFTGLIGV